MPFFLPEAFGRLSKIRDTILQEHGLYHDGTVLAGHLYTLALDAAKQGKRFKLSYSTNQSLIERFKSMGVNDSEGAATSSSSSDDEYDAPTPSRNLLSQLSRQSASRNSSRRERLRTGSLPLASFGKSPEWRKLLRCMAI